MAFDGIVMANLRKELDETLTGGRIAKIIQPEQDMLLLTIKNNKNNYKLLLSASASLPLAYLTEEARNAPMTAPTFLHATKKASERRQNCRNHAAGYGACVAFSNRAYE